ncbi:kinase-like (PK-like) [Fusarium heterosporum]|uniref:Kinase-like (PK-like) n=1 Tax=Fusarium heterosporum TaxID=42747 RepID=A0A8H5TU45_FUSHE|nr:kinase-like (PK-like) [Fusarium heterosporum]
MVESKFRSWPTKFVPDGNLTNLVTRDFILRALYKSEANAPKVLPILVNNIIDSILSHAHKILSISVYMGLKGVKLYGLMVFLINNRIHDQMLPFNETDLQDFLIPRLSDEEIKFMSPGQEDTPWDEDDIDRFARDQWTFCAPAFSTRVVNHDIDKKAILPFNEKCMDAAGEGAFGQVIKYKIYESHLDTSGLIIPCTSHVAIKRIKLDNSQDKRTQISGWEKEVAALWKMRALGEEHIVNFITAFRLGQDEHYLILEWADGGMHVDGQLLGLARALHKVHSPMNKGSDEHFRYGDLKPENILWFKSPSDSTKIGTLKIGDWGLAKQHHDITQLRTVQTSTGFGTRRYEPPEEVSVPDNKLIVKSDTGKIVRKRSRLYDLWAMGCIWLEFLIWLMYGKEGLKQFNHSFEERQSEYPPFYEVDGNNVAKVHRVVLRSIDHMAQDPVCEVGQTALGDLLEFIRDRLLVVKLPQNLGTDIDMSSTPRARRRSSSNNYTIVSNPPARGLASPIDMPRITLSEPDPNEQLAREHAPFSLNVSPPSSHTVSFPSAPQSDKGCRALAKDLHDKMEDIMTDVDTPSYWLSGTPLPPPDHAAKVTESIPSVQHRQESMYAEHFLSLDEMIYANSLEDEWNTTIDNEFAHRALASINYESLDVPDIQESTKLCGICTKLRTNIWEPGFSISYNPFYLEASSSASTCDLCDLLHALYQKTGSISNADVNFARIGSTLTMNGYTPVASIFQQPSHSKSMDNQIQLGFPGLPDAGSPTHFHIVRQCDEKVHLLETTSNHQGSWVALSHQWGAGQQFCTLTTNLQQHITGIEMTHLPQTFRDAVKVTRAIGCPYLWIDSICIVQGPDGDFQQEAKQMEQVYSGAYCVLAASRRPGHDAGFLGPRIERRSIGLRVSITTEPFFICEMIDNFQAHALDGPLSGRGWVLQEHALARRTVYYTDFQCYFECGDSVRCETMAKMKNQRAAFLGDANFPQLMMKADKGTQILGYQDLYKRYSRLELSRATDRLWAINGLQQRIISALEVQGGYGVFFEDTASGRRRGLLRRSLLWRRADKTDSLSPIQFEESHDGNRVPSWSWLAYTGCIDYIPAEFGGTEWEAVCTQWDSGRKKTSDGVLIAEARNYISDGRDSMLLYDCSSSPRLQRDLAKCVVLERQKGSHPVREKVHYVLLVQPRDHSSQGQIYERIGAGTLPGKCLRENKEQIEIW